MPGECGVGVLDVADAGALAALGDTAHLARTVARVAEAREHLRDHALYMAFAPADKPTIALALIVAQPDLGQTVSLGIIFLSVIYFLIPALAFWRSNLFFAMLFAVVALVVLRASAGRIIGGEALRRRILVLGAGSRAARIAALAVRTTMGGPVLFRQVRLGRDGRPFEVLKFRTMKPQADQLLEAHLAADPYVTHGLVEVDITPFAAVTLAPALSA